MAISGGLFLWETEELTWERGKGGRLEGVEGGESVVRIYETRMKVKTVITTQPISKKNPPVTNVTHQLTVYLVMEILLSTKIQK